MESRVKPVAAELSEDFFDVYKISPGPVLGRGMSGEVVVVTSPTDPSIIRAVKKLSLLTPDGGIKNMQLFANEIGAIQGLSHRHVVKHVLSARCPEYLVICTEYCPNGTLTSKLGYLTPSLYTTYFIQMACAVRYLNDRQRIVHNDIKPCNIFIDANNNAVLGDFGLSFFILPNDICVPTEGMGGTPPFSAPEKVTCMYVDPYKMALSQTRISKTGGTRFSSIGGQRDIRPQKLKNAFVMVPGLDSFDRNVSKQNQINAQSWATKIKDITSRLSRPTISSNLKRVNLEHPGLECEKNSQFWSTMAYCSNQYQKKFQDDTTPATRHRRYIPAIRSQPEISGRVSRRYEPQLGPCKGYKSTSSLPALTQHRSSASRSQ